MIVPYFRLSLGGVNFSGVIPNLSRNNPATFAAAKRCGAAVLAEGRFHQGRYPCLTHLICRVHSGQAREQPKGSPGRGGHSNFWPNSRRSGNPNSQVTSQWDRPTSAKWFIAILGSYQVNDFLKTIRSRSSHSGHCEYFSGTKSATRALKAPASGICSQSGLVACASHFHRPAGQICIAQASAFSKITRPKPVACDFGSIENYPKEWLVPRCDPVAQPRETQTHQTGQSGALRHVRITGFVPNSSVTVE